MQKILVGEMYQWREGHIQHLSVLHKEGKNLPDPSRGRYAAVWKVFSQKLFLSSIIISYPFFREPNSKQTPTIVETLESGVLQKNKYTLKFLFSKQTLLKVSKSNFKTFLRRICLEKFLARIFIFLDDK